MGGRFQGDSYGGGGNLPAPYARVRRVCVREAHPHNQAVSAGRPLSPHPAGSPLIDWLPQPAAKAPLLKLASPSIDGGVDRGEYLALVIAPSRRGKVRYHSERDGPRRGGQRRAIQATASQTRESRRGTQRSTPRGGVSVRLVTSPEPEVRVGGPFPRSDTTRHSPQVQPGSPTRPSRP